jgi:hypothetical protein
MSLTGSCFSSESAPRPLYGAFVVKEFAGQRIFVLRQFFCSISKTVSSSDPHFALVDARSRLAVAQTLRRAPPLSGHTLTASRATARLRGRDNDQRGARYRARFNRATTLYPVGPRTRTMMQSCASAAKLRSGGPILPVGMKAKGLVGVPPLEPSSALRHKRADKAETIGMPSTLSVYCAGRITTPSGTTPSRTSRHRAIRSLRAKATIMGFRVPRAFSVRDRNHFVKALSFWCRRNRHAN